MYTNDHLLKIITNGEWRIKKKSSQSSLLKLFVIYSFYLLWTLILKISGKSPELGILCSFQTHSYLFAPYSLPWQADLHWSHQWAPRSSGFLFGSANGRHMQFRGQGQREVPLYRLWVDRDYSSIEGHHFHCVTLSYGYSHSHKFSKSSLLQIFLFFALSDLGVAKSPHWF